MRKLYFFLFAALVAAVSCTKENPTPSSKIPEMVDLGLSVKWASFNVGATKPEEYGTYFAWGDVTGQTWDGSKWSGAGFSTAPKYEVDANGNLKPEYDAAHVNLGGDWRMPTNAEFEELINNCTSTWTTLNGIRGRLFTSNKKGYTDKSIFFPTAGSGHDAGLYDAGSCGYYWSSTLFNSNNAGYLSFYSDAVSTCTSSRRYYGPSVRAVADKSAPDPSVVIDLSAYGTANCYNVPFSGNFKFKATVKGNSTESVGNTASAEVLWESFGTSVKPNAGDIVKNVSLESGYIKFSTPSALVNGNAVIAVKDASGAILWSWHIWVCKDFYPSASAQVYNNNAGTMMDRNLGATSATPGDVRALGLLYQWGRKDPFLSGNSVSANDQQAASTLSWPSSVVSDASKGTIVFAVTYPTTFITDNNINNDWYYSGSSATDNTRWQTSDKTKGMYDPCPYGWRVPDGGAYGVWSKAFGSSSYYTSGPWDETNRGMNFGSGNCQSSNHQLGSASTIWYPAAGYRYYVDGSLSYVGSNGRYWSCTPDDSYACTLGFSDDGDVYPSHYLSRAYGRSVRCIKE